jgi:hypothetical protein
MLEALQTLSPVVLIGTLVAIIAGTVGGWAAGPKK